MRSDLCKMVIMVMFNVNYKLLRDSTYLEVDINTCLTGTLGHTVELL